MGTRFWIICAVAVFLLFEFWGWAGAVSWAIVMVALLPRAGEAKVWPRGVLNPQPRNYLLPRKGVRLEKPELRAYLALPEGRPLLRRLAREAREQARFEDQWRDRVANPDLWLLQAYWLVMSQYLPRAGEEEQRELESVLFQ